VLTHSAIPVLVFREPGEPRAHVSFAAGDPEASFAGL
jgi:hypothetical protein